MSALAHLQECGLRLRAVGEHLMVEPRSALTEDLRALIRAQKGAILEELSRAGERAARQTRVETELQAHPKQRVAFDVVDASNKAESGEQVSVILAVRHGQHVLSGELRVPRERWDLALFLGAVDPGSERLS